MSILSCRKPVLAQNLRVLGDSCVKYGKLKLMVWWVWGKGGITCIRRMQAFSAVNHDVLLCSGTR